MPIATQRSGPGLLLVSMVLSMLAALLLPGQAHARPVQWTLFAQASSAAERGAEQEVQARGQLGVAAELWREGFGCRQFEIGGHMGLLAAAGASRDAVQWASLCVSTRYNEFDTVWLDLRHRLDWEVRPSLFERRSTWRRRYTRERLDSILLRLNIAPPELPGHRLRALGFEPYVEFMRQRDGTQQASQITWGLSGQTLRWDQERPRFLRALELLGFRLDLAIGEGDSNVFTVIPLRLEGVFLAPGVHADIEGFFQQGSITPGNAGHESIEIEGGSIDVYGSHAWFSGGLRVARGMYPTFDEQIAMEQRATVWLAADLSAAHVTVRGFAAHTAILLPQPVDGGDITGGAGVDVNTDSARRVLLSLSAEVARSFYARLDGDRSPQSELGFQVSAALIARVGGVSGVALDRARHRQALTGAR